MRLDRQYGKVKNFTVIFDLIDNISKFSDKRIENRRKIKSMNDTSNVTGNSQYDNCIASLCPRVDLDNAMNHLQSITTANEALAQT